MVTTVTVSCDPIKTWQHQGVRELAQALNQPFALWTHENTLGWTCQTRDEADVAENGSEALDDIPIADILPLIEAAASSGDPVTREISPGRYLLIIPLGSETLAATSLNSCDQLVKVANLSGRFLQQQEELYRLREENDFFLKQVSDDFEELTFLRSMAERLGLGDSTHTIDQLVTASLPELGKSVHAEELYFLLNTKQDPLLLAAWQAEGLDQPLAEQRLTELLGELLQNQEARQPLIKNGFDTTPYGKKFVGVRDVIVVPVGKSDIPVGWFMAINRLPEEQDEASSFPEWRLNQHEFGTSEASLLSTAAAMTASHSNNLSLFQERETLLVHVVRTLVSAVEAKDEYTCGHSERVALYAKRLSQELGYGKEASELLYLTGLLHDVGKIAINDAILNKPDRLTDEEFAEIQRHPEEGWNILQGLEQLNYVLPGVLHHHERMDGKGYPDGLAGTEIPFDGRILAVADAYDAMTSNRAYRQGMPHEKAIAILREGAGTQWDREAIEAFLAIESDITTIRTGYQPREKPNRTPTAANTVSEQ